MGDSLLSLLCVCVSLSVCLFVCAITDFSAAEKDRGVKVCMRVRLLDFKAQLQGTGSRSECLYEES